MQTFHSSEISEFTVSPQKTQCKHRYISKRIANPRKSFQIAFSFQLEWVEMRANMIQEMCFLFFYAIMKYELRGKTTLIGFGRTTLALSFCRNNSPSISYTEFWFRRALERSRRSRSSYRHLSNDCRVENGTARAQAFPILRCTFWLGLMHCPPRNCKCLENNGSISMIEESFHCIIATWGNLMPREKWKAFEFLMRYAMFNFWVSGISIFCLLSAECQQSREKKEVGGG
jgi:hypothetical protein